MASSADVIPGREGREPRTFKGFPLYAFQERAVEAIDRGDSVIVAAPTGAGKTLIAEYAIEKALHEGQRIVYTSPIKALSNQKYRDFQSGYPERVGIMTGDVTLNPSAPILIMTTEIFRNTLFEDPARLQGIRYVIFDEIHYLDDPERGTVWEESLIFAPPEIRVLALSATIANLEQFTEWIRSIRGSRLEVVHTTKRPVPLRHHLFTEAYGIQDLRQIKRALQRPPAYRRRKFDILDHLQREGLLPCLYFCFSRNACEARAKENLHRNLLAPDEHARIRSLFDELCDTFQVAHFRQIGRLRRLVYRGIAFHHAGMLPTFKEIVERLFTSGVLKLLFTTETFALGVNMPARSVVFESLRKFNGVTFESMSTLDYYQMAGRAGRQGIDSVGDVFAGVDLRFDSHASIVETIHGEVEPVVSRFNLAYATVLNLFERLHERIFEACRKSFAAVQKTKAQWDAAMDLLRRKIELLEEMQYIRDGRLSDKGRLASRVNGYEIHVAELYYGGVFENIDEEQLLCLFVGILYEPRGRDERPRSGPDRRAKLHKAARHAIRAFQRREVAIGIPDPIRDLDFDLSPVVRHWVRGAEFEDLHRLTEIGDGDIVRTFRLAIQLMRQLRKAVPEDHDMRDRLGRAIRLVNRDVVDAERQLNLGQPSPVPLGDGESEE